MTADEQAIRDAQRAWFAATAAGDLPRVRALMTDDIVFLTPGRPPFGREEFTAAFQAGQGKVRFEGGGEFEEVVVAGEVAYARGRLSVRVVPLDGGATRQMAGYTLTVFRKQPDGRWLLARDANLLTPQ